MQITTGLKYCGKARKRGKTSDNRERKVDGFGHAEVAGKKRVEVPEDQRVADDDEAQHHVDVGHRELVVFVHRMSNVLPLYTGTCTRTRRALVTAPAGRFVVRCSPDCRKKTRKSQHSHRRACISTE